MFSTLTSILTCLAMLWHSIGGCCWHHSHQSGDAGACESVAAEKAESHHCCRHDGGNRFQQDDAPCHRDSESGPGEDHSSCGEGSCAYVKTTSLDVENVSFPLPDMLGDQVQTVSLKVADAESIVDRQVLWREQRSPLSHCALLQSWQI